MPSDFGEVEQKIKAALRRDTGLSPFDLVTRLVNAGTADAQARDAVWHLLDRGEIVVDTQMHVILPPQPAK